MSDFSKKMSPTAAPRRKKRAIHDATMGLVDLRGSLNRIVDEAKEFSRRLKKIERGFDDDCYVAEQLDGWLQETRDHLEAGNIDEAKHELDSLIKEVKRIRAPYADRS